VTVAPHDAESVLAHRPDGERVNLCAVRDGQCHLFPAQTTAQGARTACSQVPVGEDTAVAIVPQYLDALPPVAANGSGNDVLRNGAVHATEAIAATVGAQLGRWLP